MNEHRDLQWFRDAIRQLYEDAGPPRESDLIGEAAKKGVTLADATLNDWIKGFTDDDARLVVPRSQEKFAVLVDLLRARAGRRHGNGYRQSKVDFEKLRAAAWRASQGGKGKPDRDSSRQRTEAVGIGRPLEQITDPFGLEVHRAIAVDASPEARELGPLPLYVERSHDEYLQKVVRDAAAGQNGVAVLIGTSASGKTRACWESLQILPAGWRLWRPVDPSTAVDQLGEVSSRTVIWLDDSHDSYLYTPASDSGENLARGLYDLIHDPERAPVLVLDTMWSDTWDTLTTEHDRQHQRARTLLTDRSIPVPTAFDNEKDRAKLAEMAAKDPRLAQAMAEAEDDEVTQYLAGVPVLLERYHTARDEAKALIEAAMDARRLGHSSALPLGFLLAAAPAYLSDRQWHRLARETDPLQRALSYVSEDCRGVRGLLTPMHPKPGSPEASTHHYRLADFLEERARNDRQACLGPKQLWDALIEHAKGPEDRYQLGVAAHRRGLFRVAAALWSRAAATGHPAAAVHLMSSIPTHYPEVIANTGRWAAERMTLDDPSAVAYMLRALRNVGEVDAMATLVNRAASHAPADKPEDVARLLPILVEADGGQAATALANRAATQVSLNHTQAVAKLLTLMSTMRADQAVQTLAERAAKRPALSHLESASHLLKSLGRVGASKAVDILLSGHPARGVSLNQPPQALAHFLEALKEVDASEEIVTLLSRGPASEVLLDRPGAVAFLLVKLRALDEQQSVTVLAKRAASHVPLRETKGVVHLLEVLQEIEAHHEFDILTDRAAAQLPISKPQSVAILRDALHQERMHRVVRALVVHAAKKVSLENPQGVSDLLRLIHEAEESQAFDMLADRSAAEVPLDNPAGIAHLLHAMHDGGANEPTAVLADRAGIQAPTDHAANIAQLLHALGSTDADGAVITLLAHYSAAEVPLEDPDGVAHLLHTLWNLKEVHATRQLLARDPAKQVAMEHAEGVAHLLVALKKVRAEESLGRLAQRTAAEVSLSRPEGVARLLVALKKVGAEESLGRLAQRTAIEVPHEDPNGVARLLEALWKLSQVEAIRELLASEPAKYAPLDNAESVTHLLDAFRTAGATEAVNTLLTRAAEAGLPGMFDEFVRATVASTTAVDQFLEFGRECDGTVSPPWFSTLPW
ncbi:hypothetical protein OG851_43355 (plasmid) [Streptomyces sp. NBC_00161]|uniref:hypothetical protein n=1 Tax=Streptomyces sp. NBC_00161 TaxID=2975671 RepID=UPI002F906A83